MNAKVKLLLVDDEERILRSLAMLFRGQYSIRTATDGHTALALLREDAADVIVSDQRMPNMTGAMFLREARALAPNGMRILLTGYSELDAVVASVNEGEVFRFVQKPWNASHLKHTVEQAAQIARQLSASRQDNSVIWQGGQVAEDEVVLVVDDDPIIFQAVTDMIEAPARVLWAKGLDEALQLIERERVAVLVSEVSVGQEAMAGLIKGLKASRPEIISIVLTPFNDVRLFIGLINQGQVYRLLPKPVRKGPLGMSLQNALRHHRALRMQPVLQQGYEVEAPVEAAEQHIARRVMQMISRLRGRSVSPSSAASAGL